MITTNSEMNFQEKKKMNCSKCNKTFGSNNKLRIHLEKCSGKKRITCPKCNKSVLENNFKNHMERAHVNMIGKYDTSGVCHHCGEVSLFFKTLFLIKICINKKTIFLSNSISKC